MPQYIWLATVCFVVLSLTDLSKAEGHCGAHGRCEERESITFKALIGHTFVTLQTLNPEQCHERCREDIRCQSLNFVIRKGLCELNNRSRETKPQRFVFDAERFYFRRWPKVILGSTEEIPAESCKEINLNENGKASSGIYWLNLKRSDKITQVYCDMQTEVASFCVNHQCLNGASCVSIDEHYECACLPGWNGTYCHSFAGLGDIEQSAILGSNQILKQEYINTLTSYLSPVLQPRYTGWKKCYQATVDDWEPSSFRVKCTYKGPTVTIIRYGNYILGGYTSSIWKRVYGYPSSYKKDSKAFLFTLYNTGGHKPEKLPIKSSTYAIYDSYSYNPTFGRYQYPAGHDLRVIRSSISLNCHSYACPQHPFASKTSFSANEVEVFYESTLTDSETIEDSAILSSNSTMRQTYIDKLASYLAPVLQSGSTGWRKCYQATVHGWDTKNFHFRCNYKGPTVTITRFGKYIFGAYASVSWQGKINGFCGYRKDTKSFLFTLHNTNGYYPEKLALTESENATYDCHSNLPGFGSDLRLKPTSTTSYANSGCHAYACSNYPLISPTFFKPDEIEVFNEEAPPEDIVDSTILSWDADMRQTYIDQLISYLAPVLTSGSVGWKKCYQATVHGWDAETFHYTCNKKGPTVCIVRYGDYIFGGYTSISWKGMRGGFCGSRSDSKAFLFTLYNTNGSFPEKLAVTNNYAIYDCYWYIAAFGSGPDLRLYNGRHNSTIRCGYSYPCPQYSFLPQTYFIPSEIEVFYEATT